jgi:Tfp pilus assembly PilM family ATPase
MHSSLLFKLFPPPAFLTMPYAGLDISDDAIRCIKYHRTFQGLTISKHATQVLPVGMLEGGEIKDEPGFSKILAEFVKAHGISYARISIPEEKTYLFLTDVPSANFKSIAQNIEFKLDQNVPLSAPDALLHFDLVPAAVTGGSLRASVSVVPRVYMEKYIDMVRAAKITPLAFDVIPRAIVAAYGSVHAEGTQLIVHIMQRKTGLYVVSEGVVCFTSTISQGSGEGTSSDASTWLTKEIQRVYSYWTTRSDVHSNISEVIVVGTQAAEFEELINRQGGEAVPRSRLPDVWHNAFDINRYVPPITKNESLEYAVAAGLGLPQ